MGLLLDASLFADAGGLSALERLERIRRQVGDVSVALAAVTGAELMQTVWRASCHRIRAQREEYVEEILCRVPLLPFTLRTARVAGRLEALCACRGIAVPTCGLLVGAAALELSFAVATRRPQLFRRIPELDVVGLE